MQSNGRDRGTAILLAAALVLAAGAAGKGTSSRCGSRPPVWRHGANEPEAAT